MKRHYEHAGTASVEIEYEGMLMAGSQDCHIVMGDSAIVVEDFEEEYFEDYTF